MLATGVEETRLITLLEVPLIHTSSEVGQITNVLAGIAAAWSLGVPLEALRLALNLFPAQDAEAD